MTEAADAVLWRPDGFVADRWRMVGADDPLPDSGEAIVPLARWLEMRETAVDGGRTHGVLLAPGDAVEDIADDLGRLALIALDFPKFTDGRPYSAARLLRERHGYQGEIRAVGDVLLDQIPFMLRCGFDSFAISHGPTRRALEAGRLPEVPLYLQPAGERGEVPSGTRPWLRRRDGV